MNERPVPILVSACLAGIPCNYKGESKPHPYVVQLAEEGNAILACPEGLGGLSTPRPAAVRRGDLVVDVDGKDVTSLEIAKEHGCRLAILKARSPSCGKGRIYDGNFAGTLIEGHGVTAELLIKNGVEVKTEEDISS